MSGVVRELVTLWGFDIDKKPLKEMEVGLNVVKRSIQGLSIAIAGTSTALGLLLNEAGKQEQTEVAFETMIGDANLAKKTLQELHQFAASTPFTIPGIEQNSKQLLGMGIELNRLLPTIKALGDVSSGLSVPLERIALNFGQIKAQGKLTGRELRDFAVAGVPLLDELAKQFKKSKEEVTALVSAGKVGFDDVEKAFISMSSEGGRFANLMDKQSKTFKGLVSNAQDFFILMARDLGNDIIPFAKELLTNFVGWLKTNKQLIKQNLGIFIKNLVGFLGDLVSMARSLFKSMSGVVAIFGGWNNAIKFTMKTVSAFLGLGLLTGVGLLAKGLFGLAMAWRVMGNAALLAQAKAALIPIAIGAILTAIALIAEDIVAFSQGRESVFGLLINGLDTVFQKMKEKFSGLGSIGKTLVAAFLTPIRSIINAFRSLLSIIDVIRGKISLMQGLSNIGSRIANTFGFGNATTSLSGALGLSDGIDSAVGTINNNNNPISGLGGSPFSRPSDQNKVVTVESSIDLNLNLEGLDKDQAKEVIEDSLQENLGGLLREAVRDGESLVER